MRTTIRLDDRLLVEVKRRAAETGRTLTAVIEDALRVALAIESGSEWITTDRDFARFRGLRWRHPLEA